MPKISSNSCVGAGRITKSSISQADGSCVGAGGIPMVSSLSAENGNCVGASGIPAIPSRCTFDGHCIAAKSVPWSSFGVGVWDTKDLSLPPVPFSLREWAEFIMAIQENMLPLVPGQEVYSIAGHRFNPAEWDAFIGGAKTHDKTWPGRFEFDLTPDLEQKLLGELRMSDVPELRAHIPEFVIPQLR